MFMVRGNVMGVMQLSIKFPCRVNTKWFVANNCEISKKCLKDGIFKKSSGNTEGRPFDRA